jgi:hypothetical protein
VGPFEMRSLAAGSSFKQLAAATAGMTVVLALA